jgi:hypothetical protein
VPVAAAAAAVALWVIVPRGPGVVPSASEVAREAAAPPAGGDREAAASAPLQAAARPPASAEAHNEAKTGTSNTTPPAARKAGSQSGTATGATGAAGVSTRAKALDALSATPATQPAAKPVPLPPPPAAAAPPPARPAAGAVAGALARPQAAERLTSVSAAPPVAVEVLAPDPAIRWRLVGASVEQSTDAGSSWHAVFTGATGDPVLTAGSAPSASVCWLVGKRGMVLRSTDGRTFQRVVFPEATDLSAVTAVDDQRATVTAVDGRQFRTTDGGRTWVAGAVQDF